MNKFYTYAFLREDRTPYYIGKGTGNRIYCKHRRIKPPKDKSRTIFLKQNLTEAEAFRHEIYMIDVFGRKDLGDGILINRTDGGEGSSNPSPKSRKRMSVAGRGRTHSEETRIKIGQYHIGKTVSEETRKIMSEAHKGNTHSEETRKKLSEAHKGHTVSEETRKKMSEAQKGKTLSEEHKRKMSEARKNISEETRKKLSEAHKGNTLSEETRKKLSEAAKGKKWWNDGCGNRKMMIECPGDDWRLGRK